MAKERTESSKYLSKYGEPGESLWVSANQLLAERILERQALKDKITLPPRFWQNKIWQKRFVLQSTHASKLLKDFPCEVILEAIAHWRLKNVYSLGLRSAIDPICQEIMERKVKLNTLQEQHYEKQQPLEDTNRENVPLFKPVKRNGGIRNKLKD